MIAGFNTAAPADTAYARTVIPPPGNEPAPATPDLDEEARLVALAQASPEAFALLYQRYYPAILRIARRRTRSYAEAEDIAAATFLAAWRALPRYEWRGIAFGAWLLRIAATMIAGEYRREHGIICLSLDHPHCATVEPLGTDPGPEYYLEAREQRARAQALVRRALPRLTADQRRAIGLRYGGPDLMPLAEVARQLERSEGAVRILLHRAIRSLRRTLRDSESTTVHRHRVSGEIIPGSGAMYRTLAGEVVTSPGPAGAQCPAAPISPPQA